MQVFSEDQTFSDAGVSGVADVSDVSHPTLYYYCSIIFIILSRCSSAFWYSGSS